MRDPTLWQDIRGSLLPQPLTSVDTEADLPAGALDARLTEDENWDPGYARQAVEEYGRFIYLSRVSPGKVTPSDIIDTVWHAHITDSRAYTEDFCQRLFGEIVHHEPATGPADIPRHEAQFAATLALYKAEFGTDPPAEIWFHYSPDRQARDRQKRVFARLCGVATGLATIVILYTLFGWVAGALFLGFIAGEIMNMALGPRPPGPRIKSSDSGCGSGCGD